MGSPQIPEHLLSAIKRNSCVLFVGAGLSRGAGLPDWEGLLLKLIELGKGFGVIFQDESALIDLIKGTNKNYLTAADSIEDTLTPKILSSILTEIFRHEEIVPNDTYKLLPTIPFVSVITTNYDKLLESTYSLFIKSHPVTVNNNSSALHSTLSRGRFYILKAHGDIDQPETIVLGRKSYQNLLHNNLPYTEHLKTVFKTKTVLFIGFSMTDPDLELLLDKESVVAGGFGNVHYALMDQTTLNPIRRDELFKNYGIVTIPYEPTEYSHPEVKDFLTQLSRQAGTTAETPNSSSSQPEIAVAETQNLTEALSVPSQAKGEILSGTSQIIKTLNALLKSVENEDIVIDNFDALRLQLLATTHTAKHIPSSMLGNHEVNNLYLHREKLLTQSSETVEILRMLINDDAGYIPGWYWLNYLDNDLLEMLILKTVLSDQDSSVRENGFNLLTTAKITPPASYKESLSWIITNDPSPAVRMSCLAYIGRIGNQDYLGLAGSGLVDEDRSVSAEANLSRYLILARINPNRALSELISESDLKLSPVVKDLRSKIQEIKTEVLSKALDHSNNEVRFLAVEELAKRGLLNNEIAARLKDVNYDPVKSVAYRFLIENGENQLEPDDVCLVPDNYLEKHWHRNLNFSREPYIDREEIVLKYYEKFNFDELKKRIQWANFSGSDAYLSLACDHFAEFGPQLREDLRNDFKTPAEEYYAHQVDYYREWNTSELNLFVTALPKGQRNKSTLEEDAARSVEREKEKYIRVALTGLVKNGSPEDAEFAKRFLFHSNSDISIEAVKILQKWGDENDLSNLIKIAKSSDALLQELAAQAALSISGSELRVAEELLSTENEILVSITIASLIAQTDKKTISEFLKRKGYLYSKNDEVRTRVLAFYIFENEDENLHQLLNEYTSAESYYYDIVCCLDRILYAPTKIQLAYRKSLRDKFFDFLTVEDSFLKVVEDELNRKSSLNNLIETLRNENQSE